MLYSPSCFSLPESAGAIFLFLLCLAALTLLPLRRASAGTDARTSCDAHAMLQALPLPVLVVNVDSMSIHAFNSAFSALLGSGCRPGDRLDAMFEAPRNLAALLDEACAAARNEAQPPAAGQGGGSAALAGGTCRALHSSLPCVWKDALGRPRPVLLTLFYYEQAPDCPPLLHISVDPDASISSASLRRCFDAFPELLYFKDKAGSLRLCNKAMADICGSSVEGMLYKKTGELPFPPPLDSLLRAADAKVLESGEPCLNTASGGHGEHWRSYENHSYPDFAADGSLQGLFGICRDLTASQKMSEALRNQSALSQAANDASLLLFADEEEMDDLAQKVLSAIGKVTGADRVDVWRNHGSSEDGLLCTQVFAWSRDNASTYFSPHSNTVIYNAHLPGWEQELASGRSVDTMKKTPSAQELKHFHDQRIGSALAAPIVFHSMFWGFIRLCMHSKRHQWGKAEDGILRSLGLLLAATMQRRRIQEALAESEERFRDVTMAAGEIIWELDAQGYFSYVSERIHAMTGFPPEEVRGMRWEDFAFDHRDDEITGRMFQASVPTGSFRAFEHRIRSKNGAPIWLLTSGKLLTGLEGIAGLRGTSLDVTHDKQTTENLNTTLKALENANQELERSAQRAHDLARHAESASKAKSEFLANMSHEIRTPLNAIIGMAYLTQKTDLSVKQADYVDKIHKAGISLLGVINDILDFSKIESGKLEIEHLPFRLSESFENLASIIGSDVENRSLDVAFLIEHNVPDCLLGDPLRLAQVLNNIVGNAIKFTDQGGISVRCSLVKIEREKAFLRFTVRDTGIGIPKERKNSLFQSFTQVDSSITRKYGGTGLGLVISKQLLELAGGSLSLDSDEGKGTKVTINLPLGLNPDACSDDPSAAESSLTGLRVIVVDPSDMQRALLLDMLQDMGCRASAFSDIGQGFAAIAHSDANGGKTRVLILPMSLVEEENGSNVRHLCEVMHLANIPRILAIAPFGYAESADGDAAGDVRKHIAAVITRPLLSSSLRRALEFTAGMRQSEGPDRGKNTRNVQAPYFPNSRVLLVEDNPVNQQIAAELLREAGVAVTVAENGRSAVELLENSPIIPFDMVFMDLQMPEMDGFTATQKIRDNPRLAFLPIVAMTAHATVEERERCLAAGMNEHLAKPIDVSALYDSLRRWLKPVERKEAPAAANPIDDSPLPELPGIAVEESLAALGNAVTEYKAQLLQFCLLHEGAQDAFTRYALAMNKPRISALLHSVALSARGIGAKRLAGAAEALKELFDAASSMPEPGQYAIFLTELTATLGMLRLLFPHPPCSELCGPATLEDPEHFLEALSRLNRLLQEDDADACSLFSELAERIALVDRQASASAAKAVALFDFGAAYAVLHPMEKGLRAAGEEQQGPERDED
ncbi:response regulator [Desulfovibrio sp. OttesenSCG-928-A18]|nr:response regulator [Desulfovibrio sp. OttesenSCG-928-A18]